jgi:hypothetical protein
MLVSPRRQDVTDDGVDPDRRLDDVRLLSLDIT